MGKRKEIEIFCDGACYTPNKNELNHQGIGVVTYVNGMEVNAKSEYKGKGTNNTAEYLALICGLKNAIKYIRKYAGYKVKIHTDSKIIVEQFNNRWQCKQEELKPLLNYAQKLGDKLQKKADYKVVWIPREENSRADELSKKILIEMKLR